MAHKKKTVQIHPRDNRVPLQVDKFWKWFAVHEEAFLNALRFGINNEDVFYHFDKQLNGVSKRILCLIRISTDDGKKSTILFSAEGYRKLFPKILALELRAPQLSYFTVQAFIKPLEDKTAAYQGTDAPYDFDGYSLQISQLYVSLLAYDLRRKHLHIAIHIPEYEAFAHYDDLEFNVRLLVMEIIGETAYRKHVKRIEIGGMPVDQDGLLSLIDLSQLIECLYAARGSKRRLL